MPSLVVPGVRVEARFDVLPPLPATSGVLGAVGIVDRPPPAGTLIGVTRVSELAELLGPGTAISMPEVVHALSNGASEVVIAAVPDGAPAKLTLLNGDGEGAVLLRSRSNGAWANDVSVEVRSIANADGDPVRVTLTLTVGREVVESFSDLRISPGGVDDLFEVVNTRSRYVVAVDPGFADLKPKDGTYTFTDTTTVLDVPQAGAGAKPLFRITPAGATDPVGLSVTLAATAAGVEVKVLQGGLQEHFTELALDPDSDVYLPYALLRSSRLIRVQPLTSKEGVKALPAQVPPQKLANGTSPTAAAYETAIDLLSDDSRIDLVLAALEPGRAEADVRRVHSALAAHAQTQAEGGSPRIAFGSVTAAEQPDVGKVKDHAATVRSRRFVLVSPAGAAGAVAGVVARMNPQDSPTFKSVPLHGIAPARYRESELNRLLGSTINAYVVQNRTGRGVVALKGIDTTGDQVSVTRVADQAVRETKAMSENYIGQLNTAEARTGLREQLIATFTRMERDGALVPSTDGSDPAFLVDVYSTQQDFAQGIVRIDIAVRPVRAIDYVYATIRVKN